MRAAGRRLAAAAAGLVLAMLGAGAPAWAAGDGGLVGAWRVESLGGDTIPASAALAITFADGGTVDGSGGCNRFSGGYRAEGAKLAIGPLRATQRACDGPAMEREGTFFALLDSVEGFAVADGRLTLLAAGGRRVVLVRG